MCVCVCVCEKERESAHNYKYVHRCYILDRCIPVSSPGSLSFVPLCVEPETSALSKGTFA